MDCRYTLFDFVKGTPLGDDLGNLVSRSAVQSFFPFRYEAYGNLAGLSGNSLNDASHNSDDHNTADHQLPPGASRISNPVTADGLISTGPSSPVDEQSELMVEENYVVSGKLPDAAGG